MTEHKNVYPPFPPFNRFNHVSCQRRGDEQIFGYVQSKHLVFLLDFPTSGKYYNDNVILLQSLRILQKDQMLKLLISNMQSVCFVNKHI